jgi:hypothetical protein
MGPAEERTNKAGFYTVSDLQNKAVGDYEGGRFLVAQIGTVYNQGYSFNLTEDGNSGSGCHYLLTKSNDPIGGCSALTVTKISGFSAQSLPESNIVDPAQKQIEAVQNAGATTPTPETLEAIRQMLQQIGN